MIDINAAQAIARQHLATNPIGHPDYRWRAGVPTEREDGWVFEYEYECTADIPPKEWEAFGGSPAFLVRRSDGVVVELGWDDM